MLKRGEIWRVSLGRDARGTELGAKIAQDTHRPLAHRPAIVISADDFNREAQRVTVAPLMNYWEERELQVHWGVRLELSGVDVDPTNRNHKTLSKTSLIDCGQIWTVFAVPPTAQPAGKLTLPNDVEWMKRAGQIRDILAVNLELQTVLGSGLRAERAELRFGRGDVVRMDVPGRPQQSCLVVSAVPVDLMRERTMVTLSSQRRSLGQITVVPLVGPPSTEHPGYHGIAEVKVVFDNPVPSEDQLALCQEIYTLDWRERNAVKTGIVKEMDVVEHALREYLDLPA